MRKKIRLFDAINALIMIILCLIFVLPFWMMITASFSDNSALRLKGVSLVFRSFSVEGYRYLFLMSNVFLRSIINSVIVSFSTALLSVAVCTSAAYVLSKKKLVGRGLFNVYVMIPMFFGGGLIPTFLVIYKTGLYDTIWSLILPSVANVYNTLLMRNYFYSVPDALGEAAEIDGANEYRTLISVYAPLAVPMMFTTGLISFVGRWNGWLPELMYLGSESKNLWTVQFVLRKILTDMKSLTGQSLVDAPVISAKNAATVIAAMPLVVLSPILQKYLARGMTAGSVKG